LGDTVTESNYYVDWFIKSHAEVRVPQIFVADLETSDWMKFLVLEVFM
jgi:hypothetical protein